MDKKKHISKIFILFLLLTNLSTLAQIDSILQLSLWLRADSGFVLDLGGHVKQWNDLSPNQFIFVQNDSSARPLYGSAYGKPVLVFDGNNDYFDGGDILSLTNQGTTIFLLSKINNSIGSFLAKSLAGGVSSRYSLLVENNNFEFLFHENNSHLISYPITNIYYLWTLEIKNSENKIIVRKNGVPIDSTSFNGSFDMTSPYNFLIGAYNNGSGTIPPILFLNGEIAEIVFINKNLNKITRNAIEKYIMDKYAPPVKLPNDTILTSFCPYVIKPDGYYTSYTWNDNSTNDSLVVNHFGLFSVTVTDIFGRQSSDSIYVQFPENNLEHIQFLCENDSVILQTGLTYPEFNFLWQNGDTLPNYTVYSPGKYYIYITDQHGCTYFSDTIFVQYDPFQYENVLPDTISICLGDTLFGYHSEALSYYWSTGENTSFILPSQQAWYSVTITNSRGCKLVDSCFVHIKGQKPQPSIILSLQCSRQNILYQGISTGAIAQWSWIIQDSIFYNGQNVQHLYTNPGIYHTFLHVVDSNTCNAFAYSTDTIYDTPKVNFDYSVGCNGQNTVFTSNVFCLDSIYSFLWNVNGQSYTGKTIHDSFNQSSLIVMNKVISAHGCSDSTLQVILTQTQQPIKAIINFPNDGLNIIEDTILFSWNSFNQLSLIEISDDYNFGQTIYRSLKSSLHNQKVNLLPINDTLYWRVWTYNECNDSIVSNTHHFTRFNEFSETNVKLSLSADKGIIDSLNLIKIWKDFSPNQYDFIQSNHQFRPRMEIAESLNNKPVITFDGINDYLFGGNILNLTQQGTSIFIVAKTNSPNGCVIAKSLYGGASSRYSLFFNNDNDVFLYHDNNTSNLAFSSNNQFNLWSFIIKNSANKIIGQKNSSETNQISIDGSFDMTSSYDFLIGAYNNSNGTIPPVVFLNGSIAEIIMYDKSLTEQQHNLIEQYLMDKYAPPVLLPADTILTSFCPFAIVPKGYFTSYQWSTGGTNDTLIVQQGGKYIVTATDIFGRTSKDSIVVTFPSTNIPDTVFVCIGDSVLITSSLGNLVDYQWSNGGFKNYTHVKDEGWYYITITDMQSCSNIDSFYVKVDSLSSWSLFGNDSTNLCSGNLLTIESIPYNISSYIWQPTNDHTNNTVVSQTGWYSVEVQDINQCRQKDSVFVTIMGLAPIANFSFSHTCKGQETFFTDQSVSLDTSPVSSWQWIIQNDTIITQHPVYQFSDYGNYTIKLVVGTSSGCYQTNEQDISIFPLPNPSFSAVRLCSGHETYFDSHTSIPIGNVIGLTWIWGDGTSSFDSDTTHVYSQPGSYLVTLIAESDQNCVDSISQNIEIKPSPIAGFDVSPSCNLNPTFFVDTSKTDYFNPIMQWTWSFGDGGTSHTQHPNHIYQQTGIYTVELITKSLNGCMDTTQQSITVSSKPNADFNVDNACVGQSILLQDHSTITNGQITEWNWYVHNDYFSSLQNPTYIPSELNNLPFTLIVKSNTRCTDTISKSITVYPKPFVNFDLNPTYGALPLTVQFINHSEFGSSNWNFGDGSFSSQANPIHVFQDSGLYRVWLTQTSIHGCIDSVSKTVLVVPNLLDLAIESVNYTKQASFIFIHTLISNVGTLPIENPVLSLIVDGQTFVSEIVYDTLFSGEKRYYTFNGIIPTASGMPNYLCVNGSILSTQQEVNLYNNENCLSFSEEEQILNLYPNPANDQLYMLLQLNEEQNVLFSIIDITGKTVYQDQRYLQNVLHKINIDITSLSQGMYALQVKTKKHTFVHKFIKE
ncbi:MAG TPA: PKD domain-containing protein [Bacteroidales bacterium]|nr:PKD domain-containing protein [Bacteroidales bacterium]